MKRPSEERDNEEPKTQETEFSAPTKQRKVMLEAVRMPAVSNVNDMKSRTMHYQAVKLRQQFLHKNRRIHELEVQLEKTKKRRDLDEHNFVKIFNLFSEIEGYICTQTENEFGKIDIIRDTPSAIQVASMPSDQYMQFVDQKKQNLRNAFLSYATARQQRATDLNGFMKQLTEFCGKPENNASAINELLTKKSSELAAENEKLNIEITKTQSDVYNESRKRRLNQDRYESERKRAEELEKQLEEAKFQMEKLKRSRDKFESNLAFAGEEIQELKSSLAAAGVSLASTAGTSAVTTSERKASSPGSPLTESAAKEIENLKCERDDQMEISARRLEELNEANKKIQTLTQENSKLQLDLQIQTHTGLSCADVLSSDEYKNLKRYYSLIVKEFERLSRENEELLTEKTKLASVFEQRMIQMGSEHVKATNDVVASSDLHNTFYKVHHECEILRFEFEAIREEYTKTVKQGEWDELKASLNAMRSMVTVQRSELLRLREGFRLAKTEIHELKDKLRMQKEREDRHLMVPIEEKDAFSANVDDVQKLKMEYEAMRKELRKTAGQDKADKLKQIEKEVQRQLGDKHAELEVLRKKRDQLLIDEQSISDELEEIGTAVEEEQERCSQLITEKRDLEDRNLKMMNDRMVQNQILSRMRDKLDTLENKAQMEAQLIKMHDFEKKNLEEAISRTNESLQYKTAELSRTTNVLEANRKTIAELGQVKDDLQSKCDKIEETRKELQTLFSEKSKELEETQFKKKRVDEELESIRSKYERIKKSEAMGFNATGTGDQSFEVLEEAVRQMKETLTCPSCKLRPKDCIILKCHHLFCETCIKTMYDSRQRKCPKCAAGFGANDFHRVYI